MKAKSYASQSASSKLEFFEFDRREPNENDVEFEVKFCGVCHSDIHTARGDWGKINYPCVPCVIILSRRHNGLHVLACRNTLFATVKGKTTDV